MKNNDCAQVTLILYQSIENTRQTEKKCINKQTNKHSTYLYTIIESLA